MSVTDRLGLGELFEKIRVGAGDRDLRQEPPYGLVDELKKAGIGALRVPRERGGAGLGVTELFEVVADLAAADPSIAHALRNHFSFVENALQLPLGDIRADTLDDVVAGRLVMGNYGELATPTSGNAQQHFTTTLRRVDGTLRLAGDKYYSTGNIYADYLLVRANWDTGGPVTVLIPSQRAGIDRTDDWDGIGQRLTGSGSTKYVDVEVLEHEIVPEDAPKREFQASFPQLYLTTVVSGIVRAILGDTVRAVHGRSRNYFHGQAEHPRDEAVVHHTVGRISAYDYAVTSAVRAAAASLAAAIDSDDDDPKAQRVLDLAASLDCSRAKIVADELAAKAGWLLFETGGASTTSRSKNLDRHWRNARTLASHNPDSYKLRFLGDYELNGTVPPSIGYF